MVLLFFGLGQFAYPSADDFCMTSGVRDEGLVSHLWNHYFAWSGRYTGNALYAIYPLIFGFLHGYQWMPVLLIVLLILACAQLLSALFNIKFWSLRVQLVALAFVAIYLLGLRHTASSLYWMAGALTYQSGNILLLLTLAFIIRFIERNRLQQSHTAVASVLLILIVAGMGTNEINMIVLTTIMGVTYVAHWQSDSAFKRTSFWLLMMTLLCFAIVYFSPGNTVRESSFALRHDWSRSVQGSLKMGWWTLIVWTGTPLFMIASLLAPVAIARLYVSSERIFRVSTLHLLMLAGFTFCMPFILQFPAWWAMGGWPPPRTVDAIYFVFLSGWFFLLGAISIRFMPLEKLFTEDKQLRRGAAMVLLLLSIMFVFAVLINGKFQRAWQDLWVRAAPFQSYMMDRHAQINRAIQNEQYYLTVPAYQGEVPRSIYFNDIRPDGRDWRNACYARYFRLQGIRREKQKKVKTSAQRQIPDGL